MEHRKAERYGTYEGEIEPMLDGSSLMSVPIHSKKDDKILCYGVVQEKSDVSGSETV